MSPLSWRKRLSLSSPSTDDPYRGESRAPAAPILSVPYVMRLAILTLLYFAAGRFGLSLAAMHPSVSLVWPPAGLALAALLLFGYRLWPGIASGAFLVNALTDVPLGTAAGIAVGNTLEAVLGVYLLRRFVGFRSSLDRLRDVLGLVGLAAGVSTTVSATIGVTSLCLGGAAPWSAYGSLWWQWWLGDAMGALVVAPVLLTWSTQSLTAWRPWRVTEGGTLLALLVTISNIAFGGWFATKISSYPPAFAVFPFVIWAALRFNPHVAATVTLVVSATATWGTVRDFGPFPGNTLTERLILLQAFMSIVAVTGLVLAAAMAQRRRVEETLVQLAEIVENSEDAIIRKTLDGMIVSWNKGAERIYGYSAGEAKGKPTSLLVPPGRPDEIPAILERLKRGERIEDYEAVRATKDGRQIEVSLTISPIKDQAGNIVAASTIAREITERKQMQAERELLLAGERAARDLAEAASRAKDEFLATLSHELRAPLNTILMWVQLLRGGRLEDATAAYALETIERTTKAQAQIIADLLDVSRIVSGKLLLETAPVDPAAITRAALDAVRPAALAKGIRLESALDPAAGPILGDPNRLQQVLWNLLSNAVKFTPRDGSVAVSVRRAGSQVEMTVRDSGQGISPDFLPYVFDRFRQADSSTTRTYGGLGLGLGIVRHLAELHGGTVHAASAGEGQGSTFTVRLPIRAVALTAGGPGSMGQSGGDGERPNGMMLHGLRVLVVDDEAEARVVLRVALERYGAEVAVAASAAEALEAIGRLRPHVLVSDIGMPGEDGYALIRKLRALGWASGRRMPAVALTAFARKEDADRVLSAGYQAHVPKPVEPAELAALVGKLAGGDAPLP